MLVGLYPIVGDLLHVAHISAMREAKCHCDHLIVAVNALPDNKRPVQSIYERFMQIHSLGIADEVIVYGGRKDLELIASTLYYQRRFLGNEYLGKDWDGREIEISRGIEPWFLSTTRAVSSSELKERIVNRYLEDKEDGKGKK